MSTPSYKGVVGRGSIVPSSGGPDAKMLALATEKTQEKSKAESPKSPKGWARNLADSLIEKVSTSLRGASLKITPNVSRNMRSQRSSQDPEVGEPTRRGTLPLKSSLNLDFRDLNISTLRNKLNDVNDELDKERQLALSTRSLATVESCNEPDSPNSPPPRMSFGLSASGDSESSMYYDDPDSVVAKDFGSFLPETLKNQLIQTGSLSSSLPQIETVKGCVMIADISGFTKLGEKLRRKYGEGEGAARLASDINDVLSEFILCVYAYGGDIVKFAGDAIICVFQGRHEDMHVDPAKYQTTATLKAQLCAKSLINLVDDDAGGLKMHGGICWGEIHFLRVGSEVKGPGNAMFMVAGKCVEGAGDALEETSHGQVMMYNTKEMITAETEIKREDDFLKTLRLNPREMVKKHVKIPHYGVAYISSLCHLRLGNMKHSQFTMTDDIRRASVVFLSLPELQLDYSDFANLKLLNSVFVKITAITYKFSGFCRDFLFEDKGCTFIAVFGALSRGEHDELAAVLASIEMQKVLKDTFNMSKYRIGVSSGDVFCGLAGPIIRKDCIVMGSEVNMAARLMGKAKPGSILVSKKVYKLTDHSVVYSGVITVNIKGFEGGFSSYSPVSVQRNNRRSIVDVMTHKKTYMVGRDDEVSMGMKWITESSKKERPGLLVVEGDSGMGKSVYLESLAMGASLTFREPWFVFGSEVDQHSPFQVFAGVISDIICDILKLDSIDDINFHSVALEKIFHGPNDRKICSIIVPQLAPAFQLQGLGLSNKQVYEQLHNVILHLLNLAEPGLLVIDDAQWIDPKSWELLIKIFSGGTALAKKFKHMVVVATRPITNKGGLLAKFMEWFAWKKPDTLEDFKTRHNNGMTEQSTTRSTREHGRTDFKPLFAQITLKDLKEKNMREIIAKELDCTVEQIDEDLYHRVLEAAGGSPSNAKIYVSWAREKHVIIEPGTKDESTEGTIAGGKVGTYKSVKGPPLTRVGSYSKSSKEDEAPYQKKRTTSSVRVRGGPGQSTREELNLNLWRLRKASIEIKFPDSVKSVILSRIDNMDYELSEALKVASCIGYKFEVELLRYVMKVTEGEVDKILEALREKRFLEIVMSDQSESRRMYKFKEHPVFGSVKTLLMGSQRVQMHTAIFEYLQSTESTDDTLLANHAEESGNPTMAARYWEKAFNKSLQAFDFSQAQTYLIRAIGLRENKRDDPEGEMTSGQDSISEKESSMIVKKDAVKTILLKRQLGDVYRQVANYDQAEETLLSSLDLWEKHGNLEEDWELKTDILSNLGRTHKEEGNYERALIYLGEMLQIAREKCEPMELRLAKALTQYAEVLRKQMKIEESLEMHQQALEIFIRINKEEKEAQKEALMMNSKKQKKNKRQKLTRRFSTSSMELKNSEIEVELSNCYTFIGCCFASKKMAKEAGEKHEQALWIRNKHLSGMHPMLSESLNYVGEAMLMQGHPSKSLPFFIRALAVRRVAYGDDHPAVAHVLGLLASAQRNLGRFTESKMSFLECIEICEKFFKPNHPNLIPNLMNYGKLLVLTKEWSECVDVLENALKIHKDAGRSGGVEEELVKTISLAKGHLGDENMVIYKTSGIDDEDKDSQDENEEEDQPVFAEMEENWRLAPKSKKENDANFVLFTDPGRDLDDELSLLMLAGYEVHSNLKVKIVGCVASFGSTIERAFLCRGTLDILGLPRVPVAAGYSDPNCTAGCDGRSSESYQPMEEAWMPYESTKMLRKIFEEAEDCSIDFALIASMTDAWNFIKEEKDLFISKIRSVVIMGGVKPWDEDKEGVILEPDDSYNNHCDSEASSGIFTFCQEKGIKMVILSRHAAYSASISKAFYEEIAGSQNPVALRLFQQQKHSITHLWSRAASMIGTPEREDLPARCDKAWFCKTFCNGKDLGHLSRDDEIWEHIESFNLYDPLSLLGGLKSCRSYFDVVEHEVNGVKHDLIGVSKERNGIVDRTRVELVHFLMEKISAGVLLPRLPREGDEREEGVMEV
mmetsp:Transcript_22021/g.45872  ORF Transcript_22021/g.45872 Transcript_22021/m.45872 type:complete len:1993 (-) Transcript_22021:215-6193(-)